MQRCSFSQDPKMMSWREKAEKARRQWLQDDEEDDVVVTAVLESSQSSVKSRKKRRFSGRRYIERDREEGHRRIMKDYLNAEPVFPEAVFRRRFRMSSFLFRNILEEIQHHNLFFVQRRDATGRLGASAVQKMTAALRVLAYGASADSIDEYVRLGESTIIECVKQFCCSIVELYSERYLNCPSEEEMKAITQFNSSRGFPGLLGSLDCMHWVWKNAPKAFQGQFKGYKKNASTMVLEAIVSHDLYFWHAFFGSPGSLNDINILDRSPLMSDLYNGRYVECYYTLNGKARNQPYWLVDGIYPELSCFVKTIAEPVGEKDQYFAARQESVRKDVERGFGVLQNRWRILKTPCEYWYRSEIIQIAYACVILHNMIVRDAQNASNFEVDIDSFEFNNLDEMEPGELNPHDREDTSTYVSIERCSIHDSLSGTAARLLQNMNVIGQKEAHYLLKKDLIEHLWNTK